MAFCFDVAIFVDCSFFRCESVVGVVQESNSLKDSRENRGD